MPTNVVDLWNQQLVEATSLTLSAGLPVDVLTSSEMSNSGNYNSLQVSVKYEDLLPADKLGSFYLMAEVDFKDANGSWRLLPMYQSQPLRKSTQAPERVLIMQPNINVSNLGEAESIKRGPYDICEVSRSQGSLPDTPTRVRIVLIEDDPAGADAFVSVKVTCEAEQYSV